MIPSGKTAPDWEHIEANYRAGILSLREIAAPYLITHQAVAKRAKTRGWTRDLSAKIKFKTNALLNKSAVDRVMCHQGLPTAASEQLATTVDAQAIAHVRLAHRRDISRFRALLVSLLDELESQTKHHDLYRQLGELLRAEDERGVDKLNDLYCATLNLAARTDLVKKLSDTLKMLITLERQAYDLDEADKGGSRVPSGLSHFYGSDVTQ